MDWKGFFKPTKSKIILTIIIFLLLPLPIKLWTGIICEPCLPDAEDCSCSSYYQGPMILGILFIPLNLFGIGYNPLVIPSIFINIIGSYIISCLIIFIYKKYRRK